jgi:hypothetical protein
MQQADQNEVGENDNKEQDALPEWRQESFIWDQVVKRARAMHEECKQIPIHLQKSIEVIKYTNISLLPFGVATDVMEKPQTKDWPVCSLPPEKSCNVTKFSVIFISHTTHRLREMSGRINRLIKGNHQRIQEIILVWNNDRTALEGDKFGQSNPKNDGDSTHPLRIFFSFEEGLGNNLLNRYHPKVNPSSPAIFNYEDDGPFWPAFAIESGFQLWRRS